MRLLGRAPMQSDWCPYKKRKFGHTDRRAQSASVLNRCEQVLTCAAIVIDVEGQRVHDVP